MLRHPAFRYLLLVVLCLLALMGAGPRRMIRGFPLGSVVSVDSDAGEVSVDLGSRDGVMKGIGFVIVDDKGNTAASITAKEIYPDMFWSGKIDPGVLSAVKAGMQVRWLFTLEVTALLTARKQDTVEAYRGFIKRYPGSAFIPGLIKGLPDATLKALNPDYYDAWKLYTREAFQGIIKKYPGTGYAAAAQSEIKSIEAYEAQEEREKKEREKRAAEAEAERARQEAIELKVQERQDRARRREVLGKIINRSGSAVRFVFTPDDLPETTVQAGATADARAAAGRYHYKVYKVEPNPPAPAFGEEAKPPDPVKEGDIDLEFDFWELDYP